MHHPNKNQFTDKNITTGLETQRHMMLAMFFRGQKSTQNVFAGILFHAKKLHKINNNMESSHTPGSGCT
jgi:hypothetical protein